jgi:hypothetical protein
MFRVIPSPIIKGRKQLYLQRLLFVTPLLLSAAIVEELELVPVPALPISPVTFSTLNSLICYIINPSVHRQLYLPKDNTPVPSSSLNVPTRSSTAANYISVRMLTASSCNTVTSQQSLHAHPLE